MSVAGCTTMYDPCFAPPSQVASLRLLAVRLDPPEIVYDPATLETAGPVRVRPLFAYPLPVRDLVGVRVRLCGRTVEGGRCPEKTPWSEPSLGDQFDLPELEVEVPPSLIAEARAADPLAGYEGVRITVELQVTGGDGVAIPATKLLVASEIGGGRLPNHALELDGVRIVRADGSVHPVDPAVSVRLDVGESVGLVPLISAGPGATEAAEEYDTVSLEGQRLRLRERISYSFFVTPHAQFGPVGRPSPGADEADEPAPGEPYPAEGIARLSALYESPARVFVVARDGRGAEAFYSFPIDQQDQRSCFRGNLQTKCGSLEIGCQ